ncbi:hypothetical protein [Enterococcus sp. BWR-S5]|uniref:hypothetical protein n=1 Tax=Enterococcus sp. BWR-S5 TaxID=2787714 RepID=UPI0019211963|nr:hypothetical protein [Enterococcus sp. BWR-S5]MBL1227170.1 hypothetical protein [Enterococcus sp. BWR-S5]
MTVAEAINHYYNNKDYTQVVVTYKMGEGDFTDQVKITEPAEMLGNLVVLTEKNKSVHLFPEKNLIRVLATARKGI